MKTITNLLFYFILLDGFSQNIKIWGKVLDSKTEFPLENVSIYIREGNTGTFSNERGEFIFTFDDTSSSIIFQLIGYKPFEIYEFAKNENVIIKLEQDPFFLDEIIVRADSSLRIMTEAFSRIKENYPNKQHLLKGYYRESVLRDNTYVRFLDAAIGINDFSYKSNPLRRKIQVYNIRKSEDFVEEGLLTRILGKLIGDENDFLISLNLNDVIRRYNNEPSYFRGIDRNLLDFFNFKVDSVLGNNENQIMKIAFNAPTFLHKSDGFFYVNMQDFAIVQFQITRILSKNVSNDSLWQKASRYNSEIEYKNVNGKYYLSRFVSEGPANFDALDFKRGNGTQVLKMELWVNEVYDNRRFFDRVKNKYKLDWETKLKDLNIPYDSVFWKSFNYVPDSIEYRKMIQDIGKLK